PSAKPVRPPAVRTDARSHSDWVETTRAQTGLGAPMPTAIDREELQRLLGEEQTQLVEVLPRDEYEDEHLPGAINIPLKTLDAETTRRLERERPVIVYCHYYSET